MQLLVIRHGQTDSNAEKILQGNRLDDGLNQVGRQEAQTLAAELADDDLTLLYSSHLRRARETAEIIAAAHSLPIVFRPELAERDFGELTGSTWERVIAAHGAHLEQENKGLRYDYRPFGGESHQQVRERLRECLHELVSFHVKDTVAAVTHGGIIRLLYDEFRVEQPERVPNASVHRFEV